jgi:hypothetical protein
LILSGQLVSGHGSAACAYRKSHLGQEVTAAYRMQITCSVSAGAKIPLVPVENSRVVKESSDSGVELKQAAESVAAANGPGFPGRDRRVRAGTPWEDDCRGVALLNSRGEFG